MGIRDRLRKLEDAFRDRRPTLDEAQHAWERITANARARLRGESVDEEQRAWDREVIERWQRATCADLEGEAEKARQKLVDVGSRHS
jgi:hypothetical protein